MDRKGWLQPVWNVEEVLDKEEDWTIGRMNESVHMLGYDDLLGRPSRDINTF